VFKTRFGKVGVLVCWDQWYPEAARLLALQGAEVIVYPTAIGSIDSEPVEEHAMQLDAWQTVQRGHAIANGVFVAAVNRVGREGGIDFWGHSFAVGPLGEWLVDASQTQAELQIVRCDRDRQTEVRNIWPFFRDRRIDTYAGIDRRFVASNDDETQG
jgi:N-carbamoylputrescine amidase